MTKRSVNDMMNRIEDLEGHFVEEGEAVSIKTIEFAKKMLVYLDDAQDTDFCIYPTPDGDIVFEWDDGRELVIRDLG